MTIEEFEAKVKEGALLVILEDLVIDVEKYMDNHPGGKFVLNHQIGRDISKFFYGGYSLESGVENHTHSQIAR